MTFVNTTAIAYGQKIGRSLIILVYALAVVFTNVMRLRVVEGAKAWHGHFAEPHPLLDWPALLVKAWSPNLNSSVPSTWILLACH